MVETVTSGKTNSAFRFTLSRAGALLAEWLLIVTLCAAYAGCPPPDVNESYYLVKAKHYWQPDWCRRDLFLQSANTHAFFYATVGWLTSVLSLERAAYVGRLMAWGVLAWGWLTMCRGLFQLPLLGLLATAWFLVLTGARMAGEWLIGGVEAKVFAYGFAFAGLGRWLGGEFRRPWLYWGISGLWHPLVGGWTIVAGLGAALLDGQVRRQWKTMLPWIVGGLVLALPGFLAASPAVLAQVSPEEARQAARILVYERLPHHLVFHRFRYADMAALGTLAAAVLGWSYWLSRYQVPNRRLAAFTTGAVMIAVAGIAIDQSLLWNLDLAAQLLKFYWYRLADVMVPVTAALLIAQGYALLRLRDRRRAEYYLIVVLLLPTLVLGWKVGRQLSDVRPRAERAFDSWANDQAGRLRLHRNWLAVCRFVREHTPEDALFLTPFYQQSFKWHAQRAEVVNWKDFPQDANSILEWYRRVMDIFPNNTARSDITYWRDEEIVEKMRRYGAEYLVLQRLPGASRTIRSGLIPIYPRSGDINEDFVVYRVAP